MKKDFNVSSPIPTLVVVAAFLILFLMLILRA